MRSSSLPTLQYNFQYYRWSCENKRQIDKKITQIIFTGECIMPMHTLHTIIMMRYLITQVRREQNTEINVHLFENTSDNMRQRTKWKYIK